MRVTIIIPYKESRGYLWEAVASCEHQEGWRLGKDYEIIVQHGGTLGENVNAALKKAKGKYIKNCADDDRLAPGCLQALYTFAVKGDYDFVCADSYNFEKYGTPTELICSEIPERVNQLAERNTIHGGTILYRREAMPEWNPQHWTGEEYAVTLAMAEAGCKFGKLDEVVYWYRIHHLQKSLVYKSQDGEKIKARYKFILNEIQRDYLNSQKYIVRT